MRSPSLVGLLVVVGMAGACSGATFEAASGTGGMSAKSGASGAGAGRAGAGGAVDAGSAGRQTAGGKAGAGARAGRGGMAGQGAAAGLGGGGRGSAGQATGGGELGGEAGAGTAGTSGGCNCQPGQYCRGDQCFDCSDLSQLDFAKPQPLLDHPALAVHFPRPGDVPGSLFFTLASGDSAALWYESSIDAPPGGQLGDAMTLGRSALFYFDDPDNAGFNSLFDEQDPGGRRSLRGARFFAGELSSIEDAPAPLTPGDFDDYSVTLAPQTGRFFWMSTRSGSPALVTGLLGTSQADAVNVVGSGASGMGCTLAADAPWVNGDGSLLVVSAPALDETCQPVNGGATDLFVAPLSAQTGKPVASAIPLAGVNVTTDASSETDAAFSNDLCTLYFVSDGGVSGGFDLFRATRR